MLLRTPDEKGREGGGKQKNMTNVCISSHRKLHPSLSSRSGSRVERFLCFPFLREWVGVVAVIYSICSGEIADVDCRGRAPRPVPSSFLLQTTTTPKGGTFVQYLGVFLANPIHAQRSSTPVYSVQNPLPPPGAATQTQLAKLRTWAQPNCRSSQQLCSFFSFFFNTVLPSNSTKNTEEVH